MKIALPCKSSFNWYWTGAFPSDGELIKHLNVAPNSLRVNAMDNFDRTVYKPFVSDDSFVAEKKYEKRENKKKVFYFRFQNEIR